MEQQIHFCTTHDGVQIAYGTAGQGPPLVKAANWLSHLEFDWQSPIWRHLLREFSRDHTFIRYDERGNGLSDWNVADLSFNAWVEDLESVVNAAKVDRFPLLGISQGGAVAIAYAVRHPEKVSHLILYGAYARGWITRDSAEEIEQRQAQLTLVRLGWGKDNPAFRCDVIRDLMPHLRRSTLSCFDCPRAHARGYLRTVLRTSPGTLSGAFIRTQ